MRFEIKKFRSCRGMDGEAFSFDLFVDGKRYAEVMDEGCGGSLLVHWADQHHGGPFEDEVEKHIASLPHRPVEDVFGLKWREEFKDLVAEHPDGKMPWDVESFLNNLVDDYQEQKIIKRHCAKKTLFRKPNETYQAGEYCTFNRPYDAAVKAHLEGKYPGVIILNEQFKKAS